MPANTFRPASPLVQSLASLLRCAERRAGDPAVAEWCALLAKGEAASGTTYAQVVAAKPATGQRRKAVGP